MSAHKLADRLTKVLPGQRFEESVWLLGLLNTTNVIKSLDYSDTDIY